MKGMDFYAEMNVGELRRALAFVEQVASRRTTIPVLSMARIDVARSGKVTLRATDLDIELETSFEAEKPAGGGFSVLVRPQAVSSFLRAADGAETVKIGSVVKTMTVRFENDGCAMTLRMVADKNDWPAGLAEKPFTESATVEAAPDAIRTALRAVIPAVSTKETRYRLNGVYWHGVAPEGETPCLVMVATDGHRLARYTTETPWNGLPACIVPQRTAQILHRVLSRAGSNGAPIQIIGGRNLYRTRKSVKDDQGKLVSVPDPEGRDEWHAPVLQFIGPNWTIRSKTIDGTYPNYTSVIPAADRPVNISVAVTAHALRRLVVALQVFGDISRAAKIDGDAGRITMSDMEGNSASVPCAGRGAPFGMNRRYVMDFVAPYGSARIDGENPGEPFFVVTEDPRLTQVIMPMRV